ncbi:MAG: aspartyl/glutamyl-tRNA amidotransferase subunit A [Oscillospiraceae bacterium]|nr:aspartyl/glutamyl-tRNA amidotransferase subunit A [Oscillospiraceae bacterium]
MTDITNATVKTLHSSLKKREISAEELCTEYLELIEAMNPDLKALTDVIGEEALCAAKNAQLRLDKGEGGTLTGIPAIVNDNILTEGLVTSCGSKMLENFIPPYNAGAVERLEDAGYVLLGKACVDEFGLGGSPRSGIAVSSGFSPYSLSSDTGGSIRRASNFYGLTGLRPTYGRVSRYGLAAFAGSFDQIGPIARTAEDCAFVLNTIAVRDPRDATSFGNPDGSDFTEKIGTSIKGMKIAIPKEFFGDNISDETKNAVLKASKELEKQGAILIDSSLEIIEYTAEVFFIISSAEASSNLSRFDGVNFGLRGEGQTYFEQIVDSRNRGFGDEIKLRILFGNFVLSAQNYDDYFKKAKALRRKIKASYDEVLKTADAILAPSVSDSAHSQMFFADFCTVSSSLAGLPCVSTPCGYKATGLPIGMSLTGRRLGESTVLQIADCFERVFAPELFDVR